MRYLLLFLICIIRLCSFSQGNLDIDIVSILPNSQVYFVGQLHNNEANDIIKAELLLSLNDKFNVQYEMLEYCHSAAFLINHYLATGDESLLKFIHPAAKFKYMRNIKAHNDAIETNKRIRFYGVDFENRENGKYTQKALAVILKELNISTSQALALLLHDIVECQFKDLERNLLRLKSYLKENDDLSRLLLDKYYTDVLLIANAQFNFSSRRDAAMVSNFFLLHQELSKEGNVPKFFASFGTGHINLMNNNGIVMQLMNDSKSPVKNNVCVMGVQYFDCLFSKDNIYKKSDGSLSFLCKTTTVEKMPSSRDNKSKRIEFLPKSKLSLNRCNVAIQMFSGMILVYNYGSTSFGMWE